MYTQITKENIMTLAQEKSIEKIIENAKNDPEILGIILMGSVADGTATEKSDVDVFVIVNNNKFNEAVKQKKLFLGYKF
jgi:predicted nucleotidyltransferase